MVEFFGEGEEGAKGMEMGRKIMETIHERWPGSKLRLLQVNEEGMGKCESH